MRWDFAVPGVPVSLATRNKARKQAWTQTVRQEASTLKGPQFPLLEGVAVGITYFYEDPPLDVDNMIKPILDGLWPEIILDDSQVQDVSGSRRDLNNVIAIRDPSQQLIRALAWNLPFVYVQIGQPVDEEEVLWIGAKS
jgi:hypothetical protein